MQSHNNLHLAIRVLLLIAVTGLITSCHPSCCDPDPIPRNPVKPKDHLYDEYYHSGFTFQG